MTGGLDSSPRKQPPAVPEPIGLVAGWGRFPIQVAQSLIDAGHEVHCVGITQHASQELSGICTSMRWAGVGKLGGHMRYFRRCGVRSVTMAGKLFKSELLFSGSVWLKHFPDWVAICTFGPCLLGRNRDSRDDSLLLAVTNSFRYRGLEVCAATDLAPELLVKQGLIAGKPPTKAIGRDIQSGWQIAKQMGGMDIGQSITIKDGTVIAVEAIEGTDACIERTGNLCRRGGWTLVKVSKPQQDMRFDVPTIGPQTVQRVSQAGGIAIAIEAQKTVLVEAEETCAAARKAGIRIIALSENDINQLGQHETSDQKHNAA